MPRKYWSEKKDDEFILPIEDGTAKLSGRSDYEFRVPTLQGGGPTVISEDLSGEFKASRESLNRQNQQMDAEARADFCSIQGDFIYRHHNEPRVPLYVPKEETFPYPLKYIDITRSYWSGCVTREEDWRLSERGFEQTFARFLASIHKIPYTPKGYMWSGEETVKDSNNYQTRSCKTRSLDKQWLSCS